MLYKCVVSLNRISLLLIPAQYFVRQIVVSTRKANPNCCVSIWSETLSYVTGSQMSPNEFFRKPIASHPVVHARKWAIHHSNTNGNDVPRLDRSSSCSLTFIDLHQTAHQKTAEYEPMATNLQRKFSHWRIRFRFCPQWSMSWNLQVTLSLEA